MGNNWCRYKLSEIVEIIGGGTPRKSNQEYWNGNIPWLSVVDFNSEDRFVSNSTDKITKLGLDNSSTKMLPENSLVISARGTVGCLAQLQIPMAFNQSCYGLIAKKNILENDYLYYLVKYNVAEIKKKTHGSVFDTITRDTFDHIIVSVPDNKNTRVNISKVLGDLDKKIELNQETNQTLEQMAQTLFKSWFVDFDPVFDNLLAKVDFKLENLASDFPEPLLKRARMRLLALDEKAKEAFTSNKGIQSTDSQAPLFNKRAKEVAEQPETNIHKYFPSEFAHNEQLGWIPKGWEEVSFESIITLIGGGTPKTTIEEYWNGDIPWFSVVDAPNDSDVFVMDTDKHVTQLGVDKSSTKILRSGTTIISARGTVGKCALVANPMAMNQSCYGINGKHDISDEFVYYLTRYQVSDLQKRGHGSVFNTITRDTFKSIEFPFSGSKLTTEFSKVVSGLFNKILNNNQQNIELTKLRDTLLPKLISGELELPTITSQKEEAL